MPRKDVDQLRKLVEKNGFKVVPSGSGHYKILDAKGAVMIDEDGPIIMSSTSSETRGRTMAVKRLMAAKILKVDPWAVDKGTTEDRDDKGRTPQEQAEYERQMELRRTEDQARAERTKRIRERLEPIVVKLGGWDKRGLKGHIGEVAYYFANRMKLPDRWTSAAAATENAESIRVGATLSPAMASLWEHLLSELESWPDTKVRFVQLEREAKGLSEPSIGEDDGVGPFVRSTAASSPPPVVLPESAIPTLALRAMFEMGVGRPAHDPDRRHVLELGEQIMRLELDALRREEADDDSTS